VTLKRQLAVVHELYCAEQWRRIVETRTLTYGPDFEADLPADLTRKTVPGPDGPLTLFRFTSDEDGEVVYSRLASGHVVEMRGERTRVFDSGGEETHDLTFPAGPPEWN
jgi:hypothetical protein